MIVLVILWRHHTGARCKQKQYTCDYDDIFSHYDYLVFYQNNVTAGEISPAVNCILVSMDGEIYSIILYKRMLYFSI